MGIEFNGNVNNNFFVGKNTERKEVKHKEANAVPIGKTPEAKQAEASSLEALGWQNMGLQLSGKVDTSPKAVEARITNTLNNITPLLDKEFNPKRTAGDELADALQAYMPKGYDTPEARRSIAVHVNQFEALL